MEDVPNNMFSKSSSVESDSNDALFDNGGGIGMDQDMAFDDPFNDSSGPDLFENMMNDSAAFKTSTNSLLQNSMASLGDQNNTLGQYGGGGNGSSNVDPTTSTVSGGTGGITNRNMFMNPNNSLQTNEISDMNPDSLLAELDGMQPAIYESQSQADSTLKKPPPATWNQTSSIPQQNTMMGVNMRGFDPSLSGGLNNQQQQQQQNTFQQQSNQFNIGQQGPGIMQNSVPINQFIPSSNTRPGPSYGGQTQNAIGQPPATPLDAAPLNIALGGGLLARGGASVFSKNISGSALNKRGSNPSLHSVNRKGSNPSLHNFNSKANAVFRASKSTSKFKSSMSEGLLARAMKSKYGSSSKMSSFNMNAEQAAAVISQNSRGGLSSTNGLGAASMRGSGGAQNATWGPHGADTGPKLSRDSGSTSSIQRLLLSKTSNSISSKMSKMASNESTSALFREKLKLGSSGSSRSSMQDLLRQSRKQSKTQSMLRQSSAQSLLRKTSSPALLQQNRSGKVDVSSLLRPDHVGSRKSLNKLTMSGGQNTSISGGANASFDIPVQQQQQQQQQQAGNANFDTLLHDSCRLYPTTNAVVESALRVDPDAVRRPVTTTLVGPGQRKLHGYPINVALTHGASAEVLKMLVQAGPDVLTKKDGSDGSGSLGIALAAKWDLPVIELLLSANRECASVADRRGNYPLHIAVSSGLSLPIVKRVLMAHPQAQEMRNFHSQTPLEMAQRSTRVGEDIVGFLQATALTLREGANGTASRRTQGSLEEGLDDIMKTNFE